MRAAVKPSGTRSRPRNRRRVLPWAILALWVAAIALAGPLAAKLGGVQTNRAVDYLPASADSTQVAKIQDALPGGEATELVLVYHRDGGLTAADRTLAAEQTAEVARGHALTRTPSPVPSEDGTTLMYPVSSTEPGQDDDARTAIVDGVRAVAARSPRRPMSAGSWARSAPATGPSW